MLSFAKTSSPSVDDGRCSRDRPRTLETEVRRGGQQVRRATTEGCGAFGVGR